MLKSNEFKELNDFMQKDDFIEKNEAIENHDFIISLAKRFGEVSRAFFAVILILSLVEELVVIFARIFYHKGKPLCLKTLISGRIRTFWTILVDKVF